MNKHHHSKNMQNPELHNPQAQNPAGVHPEPDKDVFPSESSAALESNSSLRLPRQKTEYPVFGFRYMIQSGPYSLAALHKDGQTKEKMAALAAFLEKTGSLTWDQVERLDRHHGGFEKLPVSELHANLEQFVPESLEQKDLICFDFGGYKYRCLGFLDPDNGAFEVLGFDWNFTLYNHGS